MKGTDRDEIKGRGGGGGGDQKDQNVSHMCMRVLKDKLNNRGAWGDISVRKAGPKFRSPTPKSKPGLVILICNLRAGGPETDSFLGLTG